MRDAGTMHAALLLHLSCLRAHTAARLSAAGGDAISLAARRRRSHSGWARSTCAAPRRADHHARLAGDRTRPRSKG